MELTFISKKEEAKDTMTFVFEKPKNHNHAAGQYFVMDINGDPRTFSYASSPTEDNIFFTTRMTGSQFKMKLLELKKGDKIQAKGPFGMFTLKEDAENIVMVAGGIGITPMRSMIKYATDKKLKTKITLFYFNKIPESIAFRNDLEVLEAKNKNFELINAITNPKDSKEKWRGETGYLTKELMDKCLHTMSDKIFYVSGPPGFVSNVNATIMKQKVPANKIITENFTGY